MYSILFCGEGFGDKVARKRFYHRCCIVPRLNDYRKRTVKVPKVVNGHPPIQSNIHRVMCFADPH